MTTGRQERARRRWTPALTALSVVALGAAASPGAAQNVAQSDSTTLADSLATPVDSTRLRVLQRLQRLARPPGVDSVELRALQDSADAIEARRGGRGPTGAGSGAPRAVAPGGDSTLAALAALEGYSFTEYAGEEAVLDSDRRLVLIGSEGTPARIRRDEGEIRSDTVIYDPKSQRMRTQGGEAVLVPSQGDELTSEQVIFDTEERRGTAFGATTTYTQGGEWTVRGDLPSVNAELVYGSHARFTSCQEEEPHYHFMAGQVKIHSGSWLVARPVTLYFGDVPVAWLPFIAQNVGNTDRSSGLLTPRFSINDIVRNSEGYDRRISNVGFYWATNDYMDMSLGLDWWDNNYTALTGTLRYSWLKQFLSGGIDYRQFWRVDGRQELAFDTQHAWAPDERTNVRLSARFSSNNDFVRENSFDPQEITQSIDSNGGLSRRFNWGTLSLGGNRRQFLSDDRIETTLPTANLSLSPMTFFRAPANRSSWYNNLTWSGGGSYNRSSLNLSEVPDDLFTRSVADQVNTRASASSAFNLGAFSWSQSVSFSEAVTKDVPDLFLNPPEDTTAAQALLSPIDYAPRRGTSFLDEEAGPMDLAQADVNWSMSVDYQQTLIGSTTLTPALAISGQSRRSDWLADSIPEVSNFVAAPVRISAGAQLKTDIYGFWGGLGPFEAMRHKFSPSFTWAYTPSSTPTDLQRDVFGGGDLRTKNELRIGLNQTFEAKREPSEEEPTADGAAALPVDSLTALSDSLRADSLGLPVDSVGQAAAALRPGAERADGPGRMEPSRVVKLLAINTSALTYDFVRADSLGAFDQGFTTTRITNQISSDFLRGFTISMEHDLFRDDIDLETEAVDRAFDPHLSQLNLGFSLGSTSGIFRIFRGGGGAGPEEPFEADEDPFAVRSGTDEQTMIPGAPGESFTGRDERRRSRSSSGVGGWNANFTYSLTRPRDITREKNQMLSWTLNLKPTQHWDLSWRTSYNVEAAAFNDHIVRLTRDLHRWEANFSLRQTATGNWSFLFDVALIDNRDLKFDYSQRDQDTFGR